MWFQQHKLLGLQPGPRDPLAPERAPVQGIVCVIVNDLYVKLKHYVLTINISLSLYIYIYIYIHMYIHI